ncbi:hypothetical protein ABH935_000669 [Catenulispora sp. GAS73]|uniref:hypothetical protein n=1 Tax=Catenulispora sp. GAS73 TaxID=3156269 RepID=UPI003517DA4F
MRRTTLPAAAAILVAVASCSSTSSLKSPPPAGPEVQTHLVFSGAVATTAAGSVAVKPPLNAKGDSSDSGSGPWTTQCTFAGGKAASWSAQVTVTTPGNQWTVTIDDAATFGNPAPGAHKAETTLVRASDASEGKLELDVRSQKPIAAYLASGAGEDNGYRYYVPIDHNGGDADVTIDPDLRSGTLDAWLTPDALGSPLVFHLTGQWSCS